MKTITIEVTQEDIEKGIRLECNACPIARAIRRYPGTAKAYVDEDDIFIYSSDEDLIRFATPPTAANFVRAFDQRKPVSPFTFSLEVPE